MESKTSAINEGIKGINDALNRLEYLIDDLAGSRAALTSPGGNQKSPVEPSHIAYIISTLPEFHKQVIYRIEEIKQRLREAFI